MYLIRRRGRQNASRNLTQERRCIVFIKPLTDVPRLPLPNNIKTAAGDVYLISK